MEAVVRGFDEERKMLGIALAGIGSTIAESLRPIEKHLIRQDEVQREIMSISRDTQEKIANHIGAGKARQ